MPANGRICIPVSQCRYKNDCNIDTCGVFYNLYSDDNGRTWKESTSILFPPDRALSNAGYQEPAMVEIANNELLLYMRSDLGCLWKSVSKNGGVNWSTPELDKNFPVVVAPAKIKKLSNSRLVMFYNMNQDENNPEKNSRNRSRLVMKTSKDNGKTGANRYLSSRSRRDIIHIRNLSKLPTARFCCHTICTTKKSAISGI